MDWHVRLDRFLEIWEGGSLHSHEAYTRTRVLSPARGRRARWETHGRLQRDGEKAGFLDGLQRAAEGESG